MPSRQEATRSFCTPSATSAISPRRTGALARPATTIRQNSRAFCGWSLARSVSCCCSPVRSPTGALLFAAWIAAPTVSKASPIEAMRAGSSRTRTA